VSFDATELCVQGVVDFVRHYGLTSVAVLELAFEHATPIGLSQLLHHMVAQEILLHCEARKVNGKRSIPAVALQGQLR